MSKQGKRKITVDLSKSKETNNRPSVFERLGTKKASATKKTSEHCRQWAQHGTCPYGKSCKFASTHVLISPSKQRAANKDSNKKLKDDPKGRLHSSVVVRVGRSPEGDAEEDNWDQNDLEYADTDVLEKRRQQLQRELELQLKMDSNKDVRKDKKKPPTSSSSSRSSSSSSASSSSSDNSSSSSSSGRHPRRKGKKSKLKRNSSSSSDDDIPSKKKNTKSDSIKKNEAKKPANVKKDERPTKKVDTKKKILSKPIRKKSLSPGKKSGGTPPITSKSVNKSTKSGKSPIRKEKISSISPVAARDREKERKEREKDRDKDRDKDRIKVRSRSPRKARSRSPRRNRSPSKDLRRKDSVERGRPISPKKPIRRDASSGEKHRKHSPSRDKDRSRENKDKSTERRKDKAHDDKDRHDRKDTRSRDRNKEVKRDDVKRRGRERGLGRGAAAANKGLEKPSKPMERLLPRPEERLAALAAISNRALDTEKNSSNSKDRQDDRGGRNKDRDRSGKRMESLDRDQSDYDAALDRKYDRGGSIDRYERSDDRYEDKTREGDRSPGYLPGRDRHYDSNYDMPGPSRNYPEDDRMYGDHISERRGDIGKEYDERRHRERSWEGRPGSLDRERGYNHGPHGKDWPQDDYRPPSDWGRERHWPVHEPPMNEWVDKEPEAEGWHHRGHPAGPHRGRGHGDFNRGMRMDHMNKRRPQPRTESEPVQKEVPAPAPAHVAPTPVKLEAEDEKPIPDDLSEISDDPDDILNRDDMIEQTFDEDSPAAPVNESVSKPDSSENQSTQDTNGPLEEKDALDTKEEDESNLDFEEISDGELEEERARAGVGDALGVDWASLVLDVRRREQASDGGGGGARDRWRPERALTRAGLSFQLAGTDLVRAIVEKNAEYFAKDAKDEVEVNGEAENEDKSYVEAPSMDSLHPVAALQVAMAKRIRQRGALFGSGCEIRRAVCARRDLALRRFLCRLPPTDRAPPKHHATSNAAPHHQLFHQARAMLMKST